MRREMTSWEFWPYWFFYTPIYLTLPWFWLRSGSPTFFTAVNPSMKHGGFVEYSKYDALAGIPEDYLPKTALLPDAVSTDELTHTMDRIGIEYPVVLKPDRGERGYNVEVIRSEDEARRYLSQLSDGLILQEYRDEPIEVGVMYARLPGETTGRITSVVHKERLVVTGDGTATLRELILANPRGRKQQERLLTTWRDRLGWVPGPDEEVRLNTVGNHSRGAVFRNAGHLATESLRRVFDGIAAGIRGFHLGRFDVLTRSFEDLSGGRFKIIELNGANSEPAHIYDPDNTLFRAYRDLLSHWNLMCSISKRAMDHGARPDRLTDLVRSIRRHFVRTGTVTVSME